MEIDTGIFEDRFLKPKDILYEEGLVDMYNYIYMSYLIVLHLCLVYLNLFVQQQRQCLPCSAQKC